MGHAHWPLFDLRLHIDDLTLRPLAETDLPAVVAALSDDVELNPESPVYDGDNVSLARGTVVHQDYWRALGTWTVLHWRLNFGVWRDGVLLGTQELQADDFPRLRTVDTASFLAREHRGSGIGKTMRLGVLCLAFVHLRAKVAVTSAWHDNNASLGVSRALGYEDNGVTLQIRNGRVDTMRHLRMTRDVWEQRGPYHARVDSVEPCLPFFGLTTSLSD